MPNERELARDVLSGQMTLEEAGRQRADDEKQNIGGTSMPQGRAPATAAPAVTLVKIWSLSEIAGA